jgi:hypothetical protein
MTDLRKEAKGRQCQVMIPGICNGNPETVVLAHMNSKRLFRCGMGQKVPDRFGSHSCSSCHDAIDGRRFATEFTDDQMKIMFWEGVFRTQKLLMDEGKL